MHRIPSLARSVLLRGGGLCLIGLAVAGGRTLSVIGHDPAVRDKGMAYVVALVTFLLASTGMMLAAWGPRLFRKVVVADRWQPHVPATIEELRQEGERG